MSVSWYIRNKDNADLLHQFLLRSLSEGRETFLEERDGNRSTRQNNAMWACMRRLAAGLNEAGQEMAHPYNPELHIPWSENSVKEILLMPIIEARYDKTSTTHLTKAELSEAFDILLGRITELTGVYVAGLEGEI